MLSCVHVFSSLLFPCKKESLFSLRLNYNHDCTEEEMAADGTNLEGCVGCSGEVEGEGVDRGQESSDSVITVAGVEAEE